MKLGKKTAAKQPLADLDYTAEDLRWATPQIVADYRAQRLKCKVIADIGCGIGFQTFAFAKTCDKIFAIDLDWKKLQRAKRNANILGLNNIQFIHGDALDTKIIRKLKEVEIIFCDPQRPPQEQKRLVENISPNVQQLLSLYLNVTPKIAIEFPPQIKEIPFNCEQEYLSVNGSLNRLTLYFNDLKQAERSAVILPSGHRLLSEAKRLTLNKSKLLLSFMYEVDPAITKANLLAELAHQTNTALYHQEKSTLFTSPKKVKSQFFKNVFKVLREIPFKRKEIIKAMQEENVGVAIIRYVVEPQHYWQERKEWELELKGKKTVHLFRFGDKAVIAEKIMD